MPDLVGMPSTRAGETIADLGLSSEWGRPVVMGCEARPGTIARQHPHPGTPLTAPTVVRVRTAELNLDRFRGPCAASVIAAKSVSRADRELSRAFYRFAADPSLGASFASEVWVGIEEGPLSTTLTGATIAELSAWRVGSGYAERIGPFSALDILAHSGGRFELRTGISGTCPARNGAAPPEMTEFRAISLTAPDDVTGACSEWWGITLFVDTRGLIRGVSLRLGSP
jgi:hypothetical protein